MSVMNCPFCGKELPQESKFCPYCMEQINSPVNIDIPKKKKSKKAMFVIIALLAIVIIVVCVLLFFFNDNKNDNSTNDTLNTTTESVMGNKDTNNPDEQGKQDSEGIENEKLNTDFCANGHDWVELTDVIHYDEVGHYETVTKQRPSTKYKCPVCYKTYTTLDDYYSHFDSTHKPSYDGDPVSMMREKYTTESKYEVYEIKEWVVDKEAYDKTVVIGYKCKICGEEKSS